MNLKEKAKEYWLDVSYLPLLVIAFITVGVTTIIFFQTQAVLKSRLQEKLISIASTAAIQFEASELYSIKSEEKPDSLKIVTEKLRKIRDANENLIYIYIIEKLNDGSELQFVADADSLGTLEELDENQNGLLDPNELPPQPGDPYDASDVPALIDGFLGPTADNNLNTDQWGTFLSGYAPILDENDESIAVLGIDVEVNDFYRIVRVMLMPFILLTVLLLSLITLQSVILIRIGKNRVNVFKELDRQKDELLSIVSHQLATPVSSIKWYLEMLIDGDMGKVSKEQKEHMQLMSQIALNLSDLVSMILDVSRIQLGRMKVEKQELDLNDFFKEILEIIEPKAIEKKVDLKKNLPKKLPKAMLDRRYTHMTIENLLSNAIKYTPEGGKVCFDVVIEGNMLSCTVKDTGVGIPKSEQDKIFGRMFRASNVRNAIDGNGFGLYVAKGAVEAQGGRIWFESAEGKGTTFFVKLPLKD